MAKVAGRRGENKITFGKRPKVNNIIIMYVSADAEGKAGTGPGLPDMHAL